MYVGSLYIPYPNSNRLPPICIIIVIIIIVAIT